MITFTSHSQKDKSPVTETRPVSAELGMGGGCDYKGVM